MLLLSEWVLRKWQTAKEISFIFFLVTVCLYPNSMSKNPDPEILGPGITQLFSFSCGTRSILYPLYGCRILWNILDNSSAFEKPEVHGYFRFLCFLNRGYLHAYLRSWGRFLWPLKPASAWIDHDTLHLHHLCSFGGWGQ